MTDLKKLQEMAKNGEVSKKLLVNQEFRNELKEALKEEKGIEATEEQISEIIKDFEKALQSDTILKNAELETISGGGDRAKKVAATMTNVAFTGTGAAVGALFGAVCGATLSTAPVFGYSIYHGHQMKKLENDPSAENLEALDYHLNAMVNSIPYMKKAGKIGNVVGGSAGFYFGSKYGNRIGHKACVAMGLEKS